MKYKKSFILLVLSATIVLISLKVGMFWDNVLFASKMGDVIYENNIFNWNIPLDFDPGHPPFLAILMAIGWNLFGKSLAVSHWLMLPFVFGVLWQIHSLVVFFIKDKRLQIVAFLLVVSDPTLLSQFVLVNLEVIHLFFFFLALNAVLKNNIYLKVLGLMFLGIVSYRGMMLCAGIFLIDIFVYLFIKKGTIRSFFSKETVAIYIIGSIPANIYIVWRLFEVGWLFTHPDSPWSSLWHFVSFNEFIFNVLVIGQRFMDFGRIFILFVVVIGLFLKRKSINKEISTLVIISLFSTIVIIIVSLISTNTMGHRYFIVSYLALSLLSFILIQYFRFKKVVYIGLLSSLLLGNLIVYSDEFAQGWDASLAHLPYWDLRKNAIRYMDNKQLSISETSSFFPNNTTINNVDLNGDMRSFIKFSGTEKYVFYSNVYNLSDDELKKLHQNYHILKSFEKRNVRIEIMQKKK